MKTNAKRLIAVFLAVVMMVTALPLAAIPVSAASDFSITSPSDDYTFDYEKMLTIKWTSYSGADHYWLTVKNMDTGETEYNRAVNSTSYSLYVGDFGTEYKIYAAAMDANDNVLNGGSAWDVIYVYTKDDDTFDVSEDYFEFEADGGSDTVCVYASSSYTLSESLSWITLSSTSGSSDKWITITCKANTSTSDREGTITVTHKSSGDKLYIDVYQEGQVPEIDVSEDYLEFDADGGTDTFKVYAEDAYTISENLSWISLSSTSGSSDKTITVTCSKNTSSSSREGTITVKQTSTGDTFEIEVYQEGAEPEKEPEVTELSVPKTTVTVGEKFVITIKTNLDAYGVALYVKDTNGETYYIGGVETVSNKTSTTKTFEFDYYFNKTNKTDSSGADITNTRKLYAYPIGSDGKEIIDDSVCDYVSMTVNPAEATFSEYEVKTPVKVTLGNSAVISWGKAVSSIGSTPTYKVYIDNEYYASTTSTSYTLPASYITELGVGDHGITIQATAEGHRAKQSSNHGALVIGKPEKEPEVTDLSVPKTTVTVGEEFVITIKTNLDADGVVLYVKDTNGETYRIGHVDTVSSKNSTTKTFEFDYFFNKTNKTDSSGEDVSNTRKLYAYPIDSDGAEVLDDSVCDYVSMTVNPAEATFSEYEVKTPVKVTLGNSATISWGKAVSTKGSTPTYKVYIDNEYYASTTSTSYTLPASYITELGLGDHAITIQATAEGHRAKQSSNHGALVIEGMVVSTSRGDLDGDGAITNKDRFILNRYLEKMTGYTDIDRNMADINGDGDVTAADAEYLTRYLAGWAGYEKLPDIQDSNNSTPSPSVCIHANRKLVEHEKIWVNNLIKTTPAHSYKIIFKDVCQDCYEIIGKVQGETVTETHKYDSRGMCECGAIKDLYPTPWEAKTTSGGTITVYAAPYANDWYGELWGSDVATVLGESNGRYLIEYDTSNGKKQGYVNKSSLTTYSNYTLKFEFETVILPVSGKKVLLVPLHGYAFCKLYNGDKAVDMSNLTVNFGTTKVNDEYGTITGTSNCSGAGNLTAYYIVDGKKINLSVPEFYVVAPSNAVYTGDKNKFSTDEKNYIIDALDIYLSSEMVKVPYELWWSGIDNFVYSLETFDQILEGFVVSGTSTQLDYKAILGEYIEIYVTAEREKLKADSELFGTKAANSINGIVEFSKNIKEGIGIPNTIKDLAVGVVTAYETLKNGGDTVTNLKKFFENVSKFLSECKNVKLTEYPEFAKELAVWAKQSILPLSEFEKYITGLAESKEFWSKTSNFFDTVGKVGIGLDIAGATIESAVTMFGDWQRHRALLSMMSNAIDSVKVPNEGTDAYKEYQNMKKAMELLLVEYDNQYFAAVEGLIGDLAVIGIKFLIGKLCPGADALIAIASLAAKASDVGEVNKQIRMQQFYELLEKGLIKEFQALCDLGTVSSSVYGVTDELISFYLNMAIHINQLSFKHNRYNDSEKAVYKGNIDRIKGKFKDYLLCEIPE